MLIINKEGEVVVDSSDRNAILMRDLEPGDIFSFARGSDRNLYLMCDKGIIVHLSGNKIYRVKPDAIVIWYPRAVLQLGEEIVTENNDDRPRKEKLNTENYYDYEWVSEGSYGY